MNLDRRSLLKLAMMSAAHHAAGQQILAFPKVPRSRIAVATYPFRAMLIAPHNADRVSTETGMDLAQFARFIRSQFNVNGIEPLHAHFPSTEKVEILKLRAAFDDAGVHTVNIPVDEQADVCSPDPALRAAGYAVHRKWIDIAVLLSSPSIRIGVPGCGGKQDITGAAEALKPTITYAATKNIIINLENDDPELASASRIVAILNLVASPYLRALPDFANSLMGGDEAFNTDAVRAMFAYASNIAHVKDAELIAKQRRTVSLEELFKTAHQAHFRGFYSMESDSNVDPIQDTKHLIERCLTLI